MKLLKYWFQRHPVTFFLVPFSYLYLLIIKLRGFLYHFGIKRSQRFSVPLIVVGNLTIGGTGKTPLIIELSKILKQEGYSPGIVSRGYKSRLKMYPQSVTSESDPIYFGDEPVLLAKKANCPVVISPKRIEAVNLLLNQYKIDVVLSDDGLQHLAMKRDVEIVLIDERKFGNGFCLPAGPLRESTNRLNSVDFILHNSNSLAHFNMTLHPGLIYNLLDPSLIYTEQLAGKQVHAVAGISNPTRFFNTLRQLGLIVIEHPFPDHFSFQKKDLPSDGMVIMTEKDAIKCRAFAQQNHWVLPIELELDKDFVQRFLEKVKELKVAKLA
jgi:tetraacyldisaccharide 4'-kinase